MLMSLDSADLELVSGGQNTVTTTTPRGSTSTTRSDYAFCADTVQQACRTSNPGALWGTNEAGAAQCTIDNLPKACGLPPLGGASSPTGQ
jgi:hypothetical protein